MIDKARESIIAKCVGSIADEERIELHAIGMVEDHIHVAVSIPPRLAVAPIVQKFKGSSSNQLKKATSFGAEPWPGWQSEYGVLTFGDGSLVRIANYVKNQKEHHRDKTLWLAMAQIRGDQRFGEATSP